MALPQNEAAVRLNPAMQSAEVDLYSMLLSRHKQLLDFCDPGSTLLAVRHRVQQIYSVKSNPEHVATLQSIGQIQQAQKEGRLHFVQPDIGRVNSKGKPIDKKVRDQWPLYYSQVWETIGQNKFVPDLVFIQGNFLLATALEAVKHIVDSARVVVHKATSGGRMHVLQEFYEVQEAVQQLVVFRPKPHHTQDMALLEQYLQEYGFNPRA